MRKILIGALFSVALFAAEGIGKNFITFSQAEVNIEKIDAMDNGLTIYSIDKDKYFDKDNKYIACIITSTDGKKLEEIMCSSRENGDSHVGYLHGFIQTDGSGYIGVPVVKMELVQQIKLGGN